MEILQLAKKSSQYRRIILTMIKKANGGHTGGSLSCIDILNVLYNSVLNVTPENFRHPNRDRYIHSKGHSVEAYYAVLADLGFFSLSELDSLGHYGTHFAGHPTRQVNGIEHNTGALGHGLPFAVGVALAGKLDNRPYRVFTLLGDGELDEGSNWEACMAAAHYHLDNLIAIVDRNRLQITGGTEEVIGLEPLEDKFNAFGFAARTVDGHDLLGMRHIFQSLPFERGKPSIVIASTIKGKGISFMENQVRWHHRVPTDKEFSIAMAELEQTENSLVSIE